MLGVFISRSAARRLFSIVIGQTAPVNLCKLLSEATNTLFSALGRITNIPVLLKVH